MGDLEYARGLSQTYLSFSSLNLSKNVHYFNRVWEYRAVEVSGFWLLGYSEYFG